MPETKVVFKYDIPLQDGPFQLSLPAGAEFLAFQDQHRSLRIWMLVDSEPSDPLAELTFLVIGTGETFDFGQSQSYRYLGTSQQFEGTYVWHLFQLFN